MTNYSVNNMSLCINVYCYFYKFIIVYFFKLCNLSILFVKNKQPAIKKCYFFFFKHVSLLSGVNFRQLL